MQPAKMQPTAPTMQKLKPAPLQDISEPPKWDRGLCDFTKDCGTCIIADFFPCIQFGMNKEAFDNSDCCLNGALYISIIIII